LYTGEALFQTHENLEHLAMMERFLGRIPLHMTKTDVAKKFYQEGSLKYPDRETTVKSERRVQKLKTFQVFLIFFFFFFFFFFSSFSSKKKKKKKKKKNKIKKKKKKKKKIK